MAVGVGCVGAGLEESMVLILSTSAIIGAKISSVPHVLTGLPFWIVASGNIGRASPGCVSLFFPGGYKKGGVRRKGSFPLFWQGGKEGGRRCRCRCCLLVAYCSLFGCGGKGGLVFFGAGVVFVHDDDTGVFLAPF